MQQCGRAIATESKPLALMVVYTIPTIVQARSSVVRCIMEGNSTEYKALIALTTDLRLAVRSDLISLSGALLSSRLISTDNEAELRNTVHSEAERSARLVELVQNKVQQSAHHYHTFVGILCENQDHHADILKKLDQHVCHSRRQDKGKSIIMCESIDSQKCH